MNAFQIEPDTIAHMREWVADCLWEDLDPDDVGTLPLSVLTRGIAESGMD